MTTKTDTTKTDSKQEITDFFRAKVPEGWFAGPVEAQADGDEVLVVGKLPDGEGSASARVKAFREETRDERIGIASEAEHKFGLKVSWGASVGDDRYLFTHLNVPVMTRLRMPERAVLDTLVDAGVARSRSDALAWCVRLVGKHEADWLKDLRDALVHVEKARESGPTSV